MKRIFGNSYAYDVDEEQTKLVVEHVQWLLSNKLPMKANDLSVLFTRNPFITLNGPSVFAVQADERQQYRVMLLMMHAPLAWFDLDTLVLGNMKPPHTWEIYDCALFRGVRYITPHLKELLLWCIKTQLDTAHDRHTTKAIAHNKQPKPRVLFVTVKNFIIQNKNNDRR